jgi:hypothetical protein
MFAIKTTISIFFFLFSFYGLNQGLTTNEIDLKTTHPTEWTVYYSDQGVTISFKLEECDPEMGYDQESLLLMVENQNVYPIVLNWHSLLSFDGVCKTCDYEEEYSSRVKLDPETSLSGTCSIYGTRELKFFSRFIDANYSKGETLTSFKLDKLLITAITELND